jgi:hypothetical protein
MIRLRFPVALAVVHVRRASRREPLARAVAEQYLRFGSTHPSAVGASIDVDATFDIAD